MKTVEENYYMSLIQLHLANEAWLYSFLYN